MRQETVPSPARGLFLPPLALAAILTRPAEARGLVTFAHGSGSSRLSPRNRAVAEGLNEAGFATLLFDLLQGHEEGDQAKVFDIDLLAERLQQAIRWLDRDRELARLPLGLFGASTGAAAALRVAARLGDRIGAVVARGGRPDLAQADLPRVRAPTLLIVGSEDSQVIKLNQAALAELGGPKKLFIVPGAGHLFSEPGTLEVVIAQARDWFARHLPVRSSAPNHT